MIQQLHTQTHAQTTHSTDTHTHLFVQEGVYGTRLPKAQLPEHGRSPVGFSQQLVAKNNNTKLQATPTYFVGGEMAISNKAHLSRLKALKWPT